ncbi:MAG TPA: EAL domain-containing protein [Pirellulaceae bacterium]|nr:EAL domain-containing protein [Pirellulaceae bacterium]
MSPRPATGVWSLEGQLGPEEPSVRASMERFPFAVGRRSDVSLQLHSPAVSGKHAEFVEEQGSLTLRDLGSTNGTYVNGARLRGESPISEGDLVQFADLVFRVSKNRVPTQQGTLLHDGGDQALAYLQFDRLMKDRAVVPFFQPIVNPKANAVIGFEILGRSRLFGLQNPKAMFHAAAQLKQESQLSRIFREEGLLAGKRFAPNFLLFVNTHPEELRDVKTLVNSLAEARTDFPDMSLVLEIHESAVTSPDEMRSLRQSLLELSIGIAYDDFGAGQARLLELIDVPPDYLKYDMKLVQGIADAPASRRLMLKSLVAMTKELGVTPLAEGVETRADSDACVELGFDLIQGYLFGRPAPAESFLLEALEQQV